MKKHFSLEEANALLPQLKEMLGQIAIGRLNNGTLKINQEYSLCGKDSITNGHSFSALYTFNGLKKIQVDAVEAGDIIALSGLVDITIGDTISSNEDPQPLPRIQIDEPTVSMLFYVNNGPFAGKEGKYVTTRNIKERLEKESLRNVSLQIMPTEKTDVFEVREALAIATPAFAFGFNL